MRGQFDYNPETRMWNFMNLRDMRRGDGYKLNKVNIHVNTYGSHIGEVYYTARTHSLSGGAFDHLEDAIRWVEEKA